MVRNSLYHMRMGPFIIYNQVGTLRRLTRKSLERLGAIHILEVNSLYQARLAMQVITEPVVLIAEFHLGRIRDEEKVVLKEILALRAPDSLICIASFENISGTTQDELDALGISLFFERSMDYAVNATRISQAVQSSANQLQEMG